MSVFKTTFSRAVDVYTDNNGTNIPYPNVIHSYVCTQAPLPYYLEDDDDALSFIELNVRQGDIVYNTTQQKVTTVVSVYKNSLLLKDDIFLEGDGYIVYQASPQTGLGNQGCNLYVGSNVTSVVVISTSGETVTLNGVKSGTIIPIQIINLVSSVGGTPFVALW